ncbi:hypothetical protein HF576_14850 [Microbacterium sp. CFH 90308]|uniref:DUF2975 domain-containing protein n=1 Tax=Microbacterium salsuginis TaxID=2722803 RepID=A0ABX1KG99_9MICO|nr:hypothetical protein [Microbacterium sp. CFH 90308]NLP85125.1 hypothetical protein [Microbacterium sp. CFH 90308]
MTRTARERTLSRSDVSAMWFFIVAGVALVGVSAYFGIARIVEAAGGRVQVPAVFEGTTGQAPIGPDGAMRDVELQTALLSPDSLSVAGMGALVLEQALAVVSIATVVGCLIAVTASVLRGRVFSRRNTALVSTAGIAGLAGLAGVPFFGNMVANDAFRSISQRTFDNVIMSVNLSHLLLAAFVVAIVTTVFTVGDRLQRETDLLV